MLRQKVPVRRADQEGEGQEVTDIARLGIGLEKARSLFCSTPQTQGRFRSIKVACQFEKHQILDSDLDPKNEARPGIKSIMLSEFNALGNLCTG